LSDHAILCDFPSQLDFVGMLQKVVFEEKLSVNPIHKNQKNGEQGEFIYQFLHGVRIGNR